MFHNIPQNILDRMKELEAIDARDRDDGTPLVRRLRQITVDVGQFLDILAANTPEGAWVEVGTSAGYSTMWLSFACRATGRKLTTFELDEGKVAIARETFRQAGIEDVVELVHGDALEHLARFDDIAFCFLDAEKDIYAPIYELVVPKLVKGGLLVADNATSHQKDLQPMIDRALADERVDAMVATVGRGELVCRKI